MTGGTAPGPLLKRGQYSKTVTRKTLHGLLQLPSFPPREESLKIVAAHMAQGNRIDFVIYLRPDVHFQVSTWRRVGTDDKKQYTDEKRK